MQWQLNPVNSLSYLALTESDVLASGTLEASQQMLERAATHPRFPPGPLGQTMAAALYLGAAVVGAAMEMAGVLTTVTIITTTMTTAATETMTDLAGEQHSQPVQIRSLERPLRTCMLPSLLCGYDCKAKPRS